MGKPPVATQDEYLGVVYEPVDEGRHDHRVSEDLRPRREGLVGADDDRGALVPRRDQGEDERRRLGVERDAADLVDDDQRDAADPTFGRERRPAAAAGMVAIACVEDRRPIGLTDSTRGLGAAAAKPR